MKNSSKLSPILQKLRQRRLPAKPAEKLEGQIEAAQKRGEFDNLPGTGEPLNLDKNPFTKGAAISNELLKNSGFSLPFIEARNEIQTAVSQAERKLLLIWQLYDGSEKSRQKWQDAKENFANTVTVINKRILTYNLKAPSVQLHLPAIRPDERIRAIQDSIM